MLLAGFSQKPKPLQPLLKGSHGLTVLSKISSSYSLYQVEKVIEGAQDGSSSPSRCDGCQEGSGFRDYVQGGCHYARDGDETLQDSGQKAIDTYLPVAFENNSPLRKRQV